MPKKPIKVTKAQSRFSKKAIGQKQLLYYSFIELELELVLASNRHKTVLWVGVFARAQRANQKQAPFGGVAD